MSLSSSFSERHLTMEPAGILTAVRTLTSRMAAHKMLTSINAPTTPRVRSLFTAPFFWWRFVELVEAFRGIAVSGVASSVFHVVCVDLSSNHELEDWL